MQGIGQRVGNQEAIIFLVRIVQNFKIESQNLEKVITTFDPTLRPSGLELQMIPRR